MVKRRTRGNPIPLVIEQHPDNYTGFPFITLIQYRGDQTLNIIDNVLPKFIKSYVIDLCGPSKLNEWELMMVAQQWYTEYNEIPFSVFLSKQKLSTVYLPIYQTYHIEYVTRVIGPLPKYEMAAINSIKRRKRKPLLKGVQFKSECYLSNKQDC